MFRIALLTLVASVAAWAQVSTGSIVGTVEDPTGLAVSGANITAVHNDTGSQRQAVSNVSGDFVLNSLEPGAYTLSVAVSGFKKKEVQNVILSTGETLALGAVKLEIGGVTETVSVTAQGATVMTRSSERADLISSQQITDLVVRGRNFTDLTQLLPGVVNTSKSTDISTNPAIYVMGNRRESNSVFIDGVPANDMGNGYQMKLQVSQDAVAEVKVETSNYQAEYGRMAGSNIIAVTKSGAKTFHGMASYFNRNEDYNANNFFNNLNGLAIPRYRYNTFTYNIGGPVTIPGRFNRNRDKVFFFWNQEFWPTSNSSTGSVTVPTALERAGDFSKSFNPGGALYVVRDPLNNSPFPGNQIPSSRLDKNGVALLNIFPQPNFSNLSVSKGNYNYVFSTPLKTPLRTETARIDYLLNASNTISGTFSGYSQKDTGSTGLPDVGQLNWPLMTKTWTTPSKSVSSRWTHLFSPTVLNEASFGFLDQPADDVYSNDQLQKIQRSTVGFDAGEFYPAANPLNVIPNATFGGVPNAATLWSEARFPLYNRYYIYNGSDSFTITRGSHTIKAGFYLERYIRNQKKLSASIPNGQFDFQNNAANPLNTGYAYGNAALGGFYSYSETSTVGYFGESDTDVEGYVQDNWKVSRKLTLDFGVRLYYVTPFTEPNNVVSGFVAKQYNPAQAAQLIRPALASGQRVAVDPATGQQYPAADIGALSPAVGNPADGMVTAANPGSLPRSLTPAPGLQWGPRFGFAYDVFGDGKMAIRGGFGLFYNRFDETYFDFFPWQPPLAQNPVVYYGQVSTLLSSKGLNFPGNVYGPDTAGKLPRILNYSFSIQRDIGFHTILDVAYAASLARHLEWFVDQNSIPLNADFLPANADPTSPGKPLPASFFRPIVGYNSIFQYSNGSSSNYNSLQVSAQRRFSRNLQFGVAWTWSKALDYNDADSDTVTTAVPTRVYYYGTATFDRPQVVTINYIYDLPKVPWRNSLARGILNDWQVSGITSFQSGAPLGITVTTTTGQDITGSTSVAPRAVLTGNPNLSYGDKTFSRFFDTSVVHLPAVGTYGNAPRLFVRGPGVNNWDMAVVKNIPIHERLRLQLRWEAYNAFNHTQFSTINTTTLFNPATGQQTNPQFGAVTAARDPRQLQMAVRVSF